MIRSPLILATGLTLIIALVVLALYWSGLGGAFLLDDTPNLNVISQLPANPSLNDLLNLAATGFAGIFSRPISIFSFLLQFESWPDPRNFKFVNLLIHLLNGCLLALAAVMIGRQWRGKTFPILALGAISFIWLAHPIQVSSVLYVVQRMTLLSATFTLLALLLYLQGRRFLQSQQLGPGLALLFIALAPMTLLAVLSKESGVLIFLYILVLEFTLFANTECASVVRRFRQLLLAATVLGASAGVLYIMPNTLEGYALKPFDFWERVLTQFPVLLSYIASIALLLPNTFGLFHDDFPTAQGITTLLSALPVLLVIALAVVKRRQWPLFAFAVLWFFAGHALESTFLPLEYYFEHRNYLPLFGPVFALVLFAVDALDRFADRRRAILTVSAALLLFMLYTTERQTALWGNPLEQAYAGVEHHPQSTRAQSYLVERLSIAGRYQEAFDYHMTVIENEQDGITPYIRWLEFSCLLPEAESPTEGALSSQARSAPHDYGAIFALNNLVFGILEGRCPAAPIEKVQLLLSILNDNPNYLVSLADVVFFQALLEAALNNFAPAATLATESFELRPDVRVGTYQVNWFLRANQLEAAIAQLEVLRSSYAAEIAASGELSARVQFLEQRIQALQN